MKKEDKKEKQLKISKKIKSKYFCHIYILLSIVYSASGAGKIPLNAKVPAVSDEPLVQVSVPPI